MSSLADSLDAHALFSTDTPVDDELHRMLAWVDLLRDGEGWSDALDDAGKVPDGAAGPLVELILAGEAPPVALEVLAGLSGMIQTKDYRMLLVRAAAWDLIVTRDESKGPGLTDEERLAVEDPESGDEATLQRATVKLEAHLADLHRRLAEAEEKAQHEAIASSDPVTGKFMRAQWTGPQASKLIRGQIPAFGAQPPGERERTAARVIPLGLDGATRQSARETRPILWVYRDQGPVWAALCAALDAVGAASHAGLERLRALAEAHPDSPSITWLAEMSYRVARDQKAAGYAARLDALLGSGALGRNAPRFVYVLRHAREKEMEQKGLSIHDAWLRLGALHRPAPRREDARDQAPPALRAAIRRGAKKGLPGAVAITKMDALYDGLVAEEQREMELEGPFSGLNDVPEEVTQLLDHALHYLIHGFREAYALELLRDAAPRFEGWLAEER